MSNQNEHADELFDALSKNKKKRRLRTLTTVLITVAVVLVIAFAAISMLRRRVETRFADAAAKILTHEVSAGTIHTLVSGSGTLTEVDLEELTVPDGVEIRDVVVEKNDSVSRGDVLATVDMSTVMSALSDVQEELNKLDKDISAAKGDEVGKNVKAGISGRVKILYAEKDSDVTSCMAQNGALAVLSLDGYLAVDVETDALKKGDAVTVTREDGSEISGKVDAVSKGVATVLVTDNGTNVDESVTVSAEDGSKAGGGKLYIHNPLAVTGYAGTVSRVSVSENAKVSASTSLFTLKDTSFSANYDALLRTRSEKEEILMQLLTIYRDGAILSPMDGRVSSVQYGEEETPALPAGIPAGYPAAESAETETGLLTLCPDVSMRVTIGIDETDILSLQVGQEAEVKVASVSEDVLVGTVTEINKEATSVSGTTLYSAEITLSKTEGMLPGMTADVDVKIEGVENALIIPVDALHRTSNISFVYTGYDEETKQYTGMTEVATGMQNDSFVEILSGLQAGDTVYYTKTVDFGFGFFPMGAMGGASSAHGNFPNMGGGRMPSMGGRFGG